MRTAGLWTSSTVLQLSYEPAQLWSSCEVVLGRCSPGLLLSASPAPVHSALPCAVCARLLCTDLLHCACSALLHCGPVTQLWCFISGVSAPAGEMQSSLENGLLARGELVYGERSSHPDPWLVHPHANEGSKFSPFGSKGTVLTGQNGTALLDW